jgi:DNA-binding transcriptional LysR family regulator
MAALIRQRAGDDRDPASGAQEPLTLFQRRPAAFGHHETANPLARVDEHGPTVRVGLCSSLSWGFLRDLIRHAHAEPGAPALSFLQGSPQEIIRAASRGGIDVGFVPGPQDWSQLQYEELWREPLMVLMPESHPLAKESDVKPEALRNEPFLVAAGPAERELETELVSHFIGPVGAIHSIHVEQAIVFDLVGIGFGLALTTGSALGAFHPGVAYRPLASPAETIPFHAIWRQSNRNDALPRFLDAARALAANWPG